MEYRLLVDLEAIAVLDAIPKRTRRRLLDHFARIRAAPDQSSESHARDEIGRRVEISVHAGCSIHYWIDFPDRHVKILAIERSDRLGRRR